MTASSGPPLAASRDSDHSMARHMSRTSISGRQGVPSDSTVILPVAIAEATKSLSTRSRRSRSDMPQAVAKRRRGRDHALEVHLRQGLFGVDLGAGVGGLRIERIALASRGARRKAVDAAARREDEMFHPRRRREFGEAHRAAAIDLIGHLGEGLAHRIVGNGGELDHAVDAFQQRGGKLAHVAVDLRVIDALRPDGRIGGGQGEIAGVVADERGASARPGADGGREAGRYSPGCR